MSKIDEYVRTRTAKHEETAFDHGIIEICENDELYDSVCNICGLFCDSLKECTVHIKEKYELYRKETDSLIVKSHNIEIDLLICSYCLYEYFYGEYE